MRVDELAGFVAGLSDDLAPAAVESGDGIGALLANAAPVTDDQELLAVLATAFRMHTIAEYLLAAAAGRAQANGLARRKQLRDGRDMLRQLPLAPSMVAKLGRLADNLHALPHMAREMRDGDLSVEHADAVIRGLSHVASRMDTDGYTEVKDATATRLLAYARTDNPAQVAAKAREVAHELAPVHPPLIPAAENRMLNQAEVTQTDEGRVRLEADLDQVSGEKLLTALDGLSRPIPAPDGGPDPRTRAQRLADGLVDVLDAYLARPDRPTTGGIVPHILVTVPLPTLLPDSPLAHGDPGLVGHHGIGQQGVNIHTPPHAPTHLVDTHTCNSSTDTGTDTGATMPRAGDRHTPGTCLPDAPIPDPALPGTGDYLARLGFTGTISDRQARALCCGNIELAAVLTADSVPLDLKRTQRLATGPLRAALVARDKGCQFPGCGKPASWTEAHHIVEWADGGETCLDNLVLLCSYHHHTAIHAQGWQVRIGTDGHPWFRPPEGDDWIRCHQRRSLTLAAHAAT